MPVHSVSFGACVLVQLRPEQTGKSQLFVTDEYAKMPIAAAAT